MGEGRGRGKAGPRSRFGWRKPPRYEQGWRLGSGSPGVLRERGGWAPPCPGLFSYKSFLPQSSPRTSKDPGGAESEGGPRVDSGWPQEEVCSQLGSDGRAQGFCDQVPPFSLNGTGDMEAGASAALMGITALLRTA